MRKPHVFWWFQGGGNKSYIIRSNLLSITLREKCPYSEFFWSVFSHILTEYGDMLVFLRIQSGCGKIRARKSQVRALHAGLEAQFCNDHSTLIFNVNVYCRYICLWLSDERRCLIILKKKKQISHFWSFYSSDETVDFLTKVRSFSKLLPTLLSSFFSKFLESMNNVMKTS